MTEQHVAAYREEAIELLTELEASLLDLEETPDDLDLINRVFRAMHTIKGSGAMFGFEAIAAFAYEVETVFDQVRNGKMKVTEELLNLTLHSRDHISALLDASSGLGEVDNSAGDAIIARLRFLCKPAEEVHNQAASTSPRAKVARPKEAALQTWHIVLTTNRDKKAIMDVLISFDDNCRIAMELTDDADRADGNRDKLGEILIDRGDLSVDQLQAGLDQQKPLGKLLVASGAVTQEKVQSALAEQQHVKNARKKR